MSLCSRTLWKPKAFCLWASASPVTGKVCDLQQLRSMSPLECSQEKGMLWLVDCSKSFHPLWAHLYIVFQTWTSLWNAHTRVKWNLSMIFFRCLMAKKQNCDLSPLLFMGIQCLTHRHGTTRWLSVRLQQLFAPTPDDLIFQDQGIRFTSCSPQG